MHIHIINGPNLNLLGKREPTIYGNIAFEDFLKDLQSDYPLVNITYFQSNIEGEIVDNIQEYGFKVNGIIINPASYSHTSLAIADAIAAISANTLEVHISNIHAREIYRNHTYTSAKVVGGIYGLGLYGYKLALEWLINN